jgi:Cu/Ag efflux protein CusF
MMKRTQIQLGVFLLIIAALVLSPVLLLAQGEGKHPPFDPNKFTGGVIKKIDSQAKTFEVERVNHQTEETVQDTIYCTDKTTFKKDEKEAAFSDFKEGDRVRGFGERKDGKFVATRVMSSVHPHPGGMGGGVHPRPGGG